MARLSGSSTGTPLASIGAVTMKMISSTSMTSTNGVTLISAIGVPVELPDSRANALDQEPDQVTISVDREGFIYVDDGLVEAGLFPEQVARLGCDGPAAPLITLRADRGLDYGRVMAVMGELNRGGCNRISLVTQGSAEAP